MTPNPPCEATMPMSSDDQPASTDPKHDANTSTNSPEGALLLAAAVAAPMLLAGCGGGGGGGGGTPVDTTPSLTFTAFEIMVLSDTPGAAITVNDRPQTVLPAPVALGFPLNGSSLLVDPGKKAKPRTYELLAEIAGGTTDRKYTIILNPAASSVISSFSKITFAEAKHLSARTGFGASLDDLLALSTMTYDQAVNFIVDNLLTTATQAPLWWYQSDLNSNEWEYRRQLKEWWLREIVRTPSPFTERLVAFWGNHFVVNIDDIEEPNVGWAWQDFLRTHVGGNLRTFAHDMCLQPAMLIYLDNRSNQKVVAPGAASNTAKTHPSNENFGRELLELFLLGEGTGYTEDDVLNVARAFTGHNLNNAKQYEYVSTRHVDLAVTILGGAAANFGATGGNVYDVIDRIMNFGMADGSPRTAKLVVEKLWREFIGSDPAGHTARINVLARDHLFAPITPGANPWDLKPLYKALLKENEFKLGATQASYKVLKMPIELICGFYRSLGITPGGGHWDWKVYDSGSEDQDPLAPPIVKGWLGGLTWINAKSLLERFGHMTNYGWELSDANLPVSIDDSYEQILLNISPRVFAATPVPGWETTNPLSWKLRDLIKDPAYNMK